MRAHRKGTDATLSANSYWVGLMGYSTDNMNQAFSDIAQAGGTTVRTWSVRFICASLLVLMDDVRCRGFNDVTSANGVFYQMWQNGRGTVNTGATGLQNFGR